MATATSVVKELRKGACWIWMLGGWITFFFMLTPWEIMRGVGFIGCILWFISWLCMMDE